MKLYYAPGACSLAVRITINEIGLKSEYELVDLKQKKTAGGKDFLNINPKGSVPTIETDDGEILTENAVILQYLADTAKATKLLPNVGDFKRYRILEWVNYITTELHKTCGPLFSPAISQEIKDQIFIPLLKSKLSFVDKHLENRNYLFGDGYTLPDGYLFVILRWAIYFKLNLADWPNLQRYFNELSKRKSVHESLVQENLIK